MPEFKAKSVIYKRIKESIFKEEFCLNLFKEYVKYFFEKNPIKNKKDCYNCVSRVETLELGIRRRRVSNYVYNQSIDAIEKATNSCANVLFVPIMDFYFLITSWKEQYKNSIMSVYIAGDDHVKNIRRFLITKGYYNEYFNIYNDLKTKDNKYIYGEKKLIRCIEIPKNIPYSIDDKLMEIFINNNQINKAKMILNKNKLQNKRIKYFGEKVIREMLNGKAYSRDKLIDAYRNHTMDNIKKVTPVSFLDDLELDFIVVPLEYKDKRLTI
jgi:hypothetical protein